MRPRTLTTGLLLGLLVSCNGTIQKATFQINRRQLQASEPGVIESTDTPTQSKGSVLEKSKEAIGKAAQLTPKQIYEIDSIHRKAVVPTYLPSGFQLNKLEIEDFENLKSYKISYRHSGNLCFEILGYATPGGGGEALGYDTVEVDSPALGKVTLEYTSFSRMHENGLVTFKDEFIFIDKYTYTFTSPSYSTSNDICKSISIKEAVKIVESLQYLNP